MAATVDTFECEYLDDDDDDISVGLQLWEYNKREGAKIPAEIRHKMAVVILKNPKGLDMQVLLQQYNKVFGHSLNPLRDCGFSYAKLLEHLVGDILEERYGRYSPSKRLLALEVKVKSPVAISPPPSPVKTPPAISPVTIPPANSPVKQKSPWRPVSKAQAVLPPAEIKPTEMPPEDLRLLHEALLNDKPDGVLLEFLPDIFLKKTGRHQLHEYNLEALAKDLHEHIDMFLFQQDVTLSCTFFVIPIQPDRNNDVEICHVEFDKLPGDLQRWAFNYLVGLQGSNGNGPPLFDLKVVKFAMKRMKEERIRLIGMKPIDDSEIAYVDLKIRMFDFIILAHKKGIKAEDLI